MDSDRLGRLATWFTVGLFLGGFAVVAFAQDWVLLDSTDDTTYEARVGSFRIERTTLNRPVAVLTLRLSRAGAAAFEDNYVSLEDCARGMGRLVTTDMAGRYRYGNDFVFGGRTIASNIAETICGLARPRGQSF